MNIHQVRIDGFGAWTDLRLEDLQPGLNVVYGPNEAGKSTLLEFLRSMLYGFSPSRRSRYLPPVRGGQAGGQLGLHAPAGQWQLSRHVSELADPIAGRVRIVGASGVELDPARLEEMLSGVDERTFNHVFAIGLTEIQELGTLDDSAASQLLYNLTTGMDRVVLGDVMRDLAASRRKLLAAEGEDSRIPRLLAERRRLQQEIAELGDLTPRYARAVREREQLASEIATLERESSDLGRQVRLLEAAVGMRDKWSRRALLDEQLSGIHNAPQIPPGALERLERISTSMRKQKRLYLKTRQERKDLAAQARKTPLRTTLAQQATRIQALYDQQEFVAVQERKADDLKQQAAQLASQIERESPHKKQGSRYSLATLKPLARAVEDAQARLEQVRREVADDRHAAAQREAEREAEIERTYVPEPRADLVSAVQDAGERVSQLRRRLQLDQRLEQMHSHAQELEEQAADLLEQQLLPLWTVVALGSLFVLGVVLILAGWWLSFGWTIAILGVAGIVASVVLKHHLENAAEEQLDNNEKQVALLRRQIKQAKEQRDQIDEELPQGGGPLLARLEKAEDELARLEKMIPSETPRRAVARDTGASLSSQRRLDDAEAAWRSSRERWEDALVDAGLSKDLTLQQVGQLASRSRKLRDLEQQLERVREEETQARQAVRAFGDRVSQLLADVAIVPSSTKPSEQLRQLRNELAAQDGAKQRRRELQLKDRKLRRRQTKLRSSHRRLAGQRRRLFEQVGAFDEPDFRRRVSQFAHLSELRTSRESLQRDIALALGTQYTEESIRQRLESLPPEKLEAEWEELSGRLTRCEASLKQCFEKRGQLAHEIEILSRDRRLSERQLELGLVQQRLKHAMRRWQTQAVTSSILESVRSHYERGRQPQTLLDASELLRELTGGRYTRVWTPMDENRLLVDESGGRSLQIEVLSRGTREQLFLSIRLALVRLYARQGVRLPMVLDDVLVNFDDARMKAAATVLAQFAEEGHQLLVFTCHEHMARLMRSLRAHVIELPSRHDLPRHELRIDEPEPEPRPVKRPRGRRKSPAPEPLPVVVQTPVYEPPFVELPIIQLPVVKPLVAKPPVVEEVGYLAPPIEVLTARIPEPLPQPIPVAPAPFVAVLEAEPVIEPPILIARPLPDPPLARPLVEEKPPLPINSAEADFVEYDPLLPLNREPAQPPHFHIELRPKPPLKAPPPPPVQPARPRAYWGIFRGHGAEEFAGEFATRGGYYEE